MPEIRIEGESVSFWLRVKPRSGRERLELNSAGELRLEVKAPPAEGKANEACVQFLARSLRLPQACVAILAGKQSCRKLVRVTGHSARETVERIQAVAAGKAT